MRSQQFKDRSDLSDDLYEAKFRKKKKLEICHWQAKVNQIKGKRDTKNLCLQLYKPEVKRNNQNIPNKNTFMIQKLFM